MPPVRIGIDLHVVDGIHQGSRSHVLELFSRVIPLMPDYTFVCFLDKPQHLLDAWAAFHAENVVMAHMPHRSAPQRLLFQLPALARRYGLTLLHSQYIVPPGAPCQTAVTIHDVLFESFPQFFPWSFRLRSKLLVRRSARKASIVCTVSDYSRQQIASLYRLPTAEIVMTPNGVDLERFHPGDPNDRPQLPDGLTSREYLLTVGRLEPRKNHVNLLRAFAQLPTPRPTLVIVGQRDFGYERLLDEIKTLNLETEVKLLEGINDDLLPLLYRHARLFVYPAFAEGFGLPVLEAMASGVPVVTSNTTSLPEVGGEAAFFCNPAEVSSISHELAHALSDPAACAEKVRLGLVQAKLFQWDTSARNLAAAYRNLLDIA